MFKELLEKSFLGNTLWDYFVCLIILILGIIIILILKKIVFKRLRNWSKKTETDLDDFLIENLQKKLVPLLYFGIFYLALYGLKLNPAIKKGVHLIGIVLLTFLGVRFLLTVIVYLIENYWIKKEELGSKKQAFRTILGVIKAFVWGAALILLLDNFGIKITTLVAGLGIGGIAIALAAQAVLGDLFSAFTIYFDRPFEVGDFIIVGDYLGAVEKIGIKTTRIRALGGEQLVFSNTDLTNSRVRNYKRMEKRRVVFKLGVTYQTTLKQLKEIPPIITKVIKSINDTAFDRAHFSSYGDFSLNFDVVYYVLSSDYAKYMDIQQEINFNIKEEFDKLKIEFAYPTQTLFLEKEQSA